MRLHRLIAPLGFAAAVLAALPAMSQEVPVETYTLPNGLTVILHVDRKLPQVTINTWFSVGSKDEAPGRSGFAHLFEHLMFMGTARVPTGQFDQIMEGGGGANNASTSSDRTNYFSYGPSSLLPTLLWLDADRLDGLGKAMTQEKLDLQRNVVRNERRENYENRPYGMSEIIIADAIYPPDHPYHHTTIGSHEDLEAAKVQDVKDFFGTYYVPGNASLVVAGDFDPSAAKKVIAETFGAVPAQPLPQHLTAPPVVMDHEVRRMATDKVEFPRLYLVWHSPRIYADGDAQMDLTAAILSDGSSGRLFKRLVQDEQLAQEVVVYNYSKELDGEFHIEVTAAEGADLERIKRVVLEELDKYKREGPTDAELKRVKAANESQFLRRMESLVQRADMINGYEHYFGEPDGFKRDLARYTAATTQSLREWADRVFTDGRLDLRILPEGAKVPEADLDKRPPDFPQAPANPPVPETLTLADGVPVYVVSRPGTGLFSAALVVDGGERLVPSDKAGLGSLLATMLTKGAGGRDAAAFSDAVSSLGATIDASTNWHHFQVVVTGLTSKLAPTLDLFADAVLRPSLTEKDFAREKELALAAIKARAERPQTVAGMAARALTFGKEDPRGRASTGYQDTVESIARQDLAAWLPRLLNPGVARLVVVGDVEPNALKAALDKRFAAWKGSEKAPALPAAVVTPPPGRIVLVDRPGAPQTVIYMMRPVAPSDEKLRAVRDSINTLFGGAFTSRLNQNIREKHGYSYGAGSAFRQDADQFMFLASASVQTAVTGAALGEFRNEFGSIASGNVTSGELDKAVRSTRFDLVNSAETTSGLAETLASFVEGGLPLDQVKRELAALDAVNLQEVNAQAKSGDFAFGSFLVVLVGDKASVLPQLKQAGFPEPQLASPEGDLLPAGGKG